MPELTRRTFWAAVVTRAEHDMRAWIVRIGQSPVGFWLASVVAGVFGVSVLTVWPFIGLPWWIGLAALGVFLSVGLGEGAFRLWRDVEAPIRSGIRVTATAKEEHYHPIPGANAWRIGFSRRNEEAGTLVCPGVSGLPVAVRFEFPRSGRFVKTSDLPFVVKARDGLRRHKIVVHNFIPGGFVFDDRDAPISLVCTIHFDSTEAG